MPSMFEPLLMQPSKEHFVSEEESKSIVVNILIGVSLMVAAMLLTWLFIWAYEKEKALFITILGVVMFLYSVKMVIFIALKKKDMGDVAFKVFMGSSVTMAIMNVMLIIFFSIRAASRLRSRSSYVPGAVQDYIAPQN